MRVLSLILVCFMAVTVVCHAERSLAQAGYGAAEAAYDAAMLECSLPVFPFYDITVNKLSDRGSFQMTEEKAAFLGKCMKERGFSYEASVGTNSYYQNSRHSDVDDDGLTDKERNNIRRYYQQQLTEAGLSGTNSAAVKKTINTVVSEESPENTRRLYNYSDQKNKPREKKPGSLWLPRN